MWNQKIVVAACAVVVAMAGPVASADLIIDTGTPTDLGGGWTVDQDFWSAGEVTLDQAYIITGIETYFYGISQGDMTIAIYDDGGTIPGTELYSTVFYNDLDNWAVGWEGATGLSWDLAAGTYWISVEVRSGFAFAAMPSGAPNPLSDYAGRLADGNWYPDTFGGDDSMGFRVYADSTNGVVPEPATVGLLGLGLFGIAARSIRKRKR